MDPEKLSLLGEQLFPCLENQGKLLIFKYLITLDSKPKLYNISLEIEQRCLWSYRILNLFSARVNRLKSQLNVFLKPFFTTSVRIFLGTRKEGIHSA